MNSGRGIAAVLKVGLVLSLIPAAAMAGVLTMSNSHSEKAERYWTAERLAGAQPMPLQQLDRETDPFPAAQAAGDAGSVLAAGRAPIAGVRPDAASRLFEPLDFEAALEEDFGSIAEPASGSTKAFFTSARLVPLSADQAYPYSTVGKLFFTIPGNGDFYCSAAVIRSRLIATAGQCVHSGTASPGFFTNFEFIPAFRDGVAPFGTWEWEFAIVSTTWSGGGGKLPNAADYALIELGDETFGGVLRKIGDIVGFLGFQTLKLRPNHAHLLGYPSNFDSGNKVHQVTAKDFKAGKNNNAEYGSDMRSGSGGGPLVQDFGDNPALARWIGALSYFNNSAAVKVQGASIPDSRFTGILNSACAHRSGNC